MRCFSSSLDSNFPNLEVTRPSTILRFFGTKRSGEKSPERASSYPKKTIDLELIEHNLRDRLISAFGVSPAQGISPAEVYRNSHI